MTAQLKLRSWPKAFAVGNQWPVFISWRDPGLVNTNVIHHHRNDSLTRHFEQLRSGDRLIH